MFSDPDLVSAFSKTAKSCSAYTFRAYVLLERHFFFRRGFEEGGIRGRDRRGRETAHEVDDHVVNS
jgi:hypothetical protein